MTRPITTTEELDALYPCGPPPWEEPLMLDPRQPCPETAPSYTSTSALADRLRLETVTAAHAVLDEIRPTGTPRGDRLRQLLAERGLMNNVEWISFLADLHRWKDESK